MPEGDVDEVDDLPLLTEFFLPIIGVGNLKRGAPVLPAMKNSACLLELMNDG